MSIFFPKSIRVFWLQFLLNGQQSLSEIHQTEQFRKVKLKQAQQTLTLRISLHKNQEKETKIVKTI